MLRNLQGTKLRNQQAAKPDPTWKPHESVDVSKVSPDSHTPYPRTHCLPAAYPMLTRCLPLLAPRAEQVGGGLAKVDDWIREVEHVFGQSTGSIRRRELIAARLEGEGLSIWGDESERPFHEEDEVKRVTEVRWDAQCSLLHSRGNEIG